MDLTYVLLGKFILPYICSVFIDIYVHGNKHIHI